MTPHNVSNEEFEVACKNTNYIRIIEAISKKYHSLSSDDVRECKLVGLWQALRYWNNHQLSCKFTTYLYTVVDREFVSRLKLLRRHNSLLNSMDDIIVYNESINTIDMQEVIDSLPHRQQIVVRQRIFDGMTFDEIGSANNYTRQAAQKNYRKAIQSLRVKLQT